MSKADTLLIGLSDDTTLMTYLYESRSSPGAANRELANNNKVTADINLENKKNLAGMLYWFQLP